MITRHTSLTAITAALAFLLAASAHGQQGQQSGQGMERQQPPAQQQPTMDVSDGKLDQFAEAHGEVQKIQKGVQGDMQDAKDQQEALEIQQKAEQKAVQAIRDAGLEPDEYNRISQAINNDPELQKRLQERMDR